MLRSTKQHTTFGETSIREYETNRFRIDFTNHDFKQYLAENTYMLIGDYSPNKILAVLKPKTMPIDCINLPYEFYPSTNGKCAISGTNVAKLVNKNYIILDSLEAVRDLYKTNALEKALEWLTGETTRLHDKIMHKQRILDNQNKSKLDFINS